MKTKLTLLAAFCGLTLTATAAVDDGSVLPFPPAPSASKAGPTLQESIHKRRVEPDRLPAAMSLHFTSNATFDIGTDPDSPFSLFYFDQAPFAFNGTIGTTTIKYLKN